jgi:hypothetical protein
MPCEEYREALNEAAAGERELSRELRGHLEACRQCEVALEEEQQLFASIDSGVQKIANAEVPASLLPRVRASLEREVAPRRSFWPNFVLAGAAICAVLVLVGVKEWQRTSGVRPAVSVADRAAPEDGPSEKVVAHSVKPDVRPVPHQSKRSYARAPQPEFTVLLPVGQKQAVDKLLGELRSGTIKATDVIVEKAEAASPDLQVSPLSITPIEVKPLATIVEDAAPSSEKTKS